MYIYVYVYIYICTYVYIYVYIYTLISIILNKHALCIAQRAFEPFDAHIKVVTSFAGKMFELYI